MIVEVSPTAIVGAAGVIGGLFANVLALVRLWHRIELRLTVIEARMRHIERNTARDGDTESDLG